MGGSKNKSPAQKQKSQQSEDAKKSGSKKTKSGKTDEAKNEISVIINENNAKEILKNSKVLTVQDFAQRTGVKISTANSYLLRSVKTGTVKRVGGHSGHHLYQSVSE